MRRVFLFILASFLFVMSACNSAAVERTPFPTATIPLPTPRPTITPQPTSTQAPATLVAPREPTPSPTPVTYKVQDGDTPIVIANKFGVSVADLMSLNKIDPASLQIGAVLIIPSGPMPEQSGNALLPSPTPGVYTVRGLNVFRTPVGSLECLGEVFNPGPNPLGNVQLQISLLDQADQTLLAEPFLVALQVIPAGQSSPFRLLFTDPPATYAKYSISPLRGEGIDVTTLYADIKVTKSNGSINGAQYRVSGELTNAGKTDATKIRVMVTTYDADKRVIGFRELAVAEGPLAPNAVQPFDISLASSSGSVASFSVSAQALLVTP